MREAPCSFMNFAATELEQLICVDMWNAEPCLLHIAATPQSATMKASTYGSANAIISSTSASSPSNTIEFSVRYSFAPYSRQRRAASGSVSHVKFTPDRERMLYEPSPRYTASAPASSAA